MKRKFILISILFLGLAVISCNNSKQEKRTVNSGTATNMVAFKDSAAAKPAMNTPEQVYAKPEVPVLCYHRISDGKKGDYTISPATFTAHMKVLADSGYHSISPAQLYDYLVYNKVLPEKPVVISFDDSRVEHSVIAAPVMEKYGLRGVFFIMT